MRGSKRRVFAVMTTAVLALAVVTAALAGSTSTAGGNAEGGSLTVWLSGTYAGSTPGSTYRKWLDGVKSRYEKANPGASVKFVLTPINNAQFTAQIAAAFASRRVPDVMLVYSGGYTTPYMQSSLEKLNDRVKQAPGFYGKQTAWDLSCLNLDCKGGSGDIYAVPNDQGTYGLFYNKALFRKAGIAKPPTTYNELLAQCKTFKSKGILPLAYGDRDGYSTDNWVIPRNAGNKDGAWEFIKMAVDDRGASALATTVGALPTNKAASGRLKDPITKFFLQTAAKPQIPLLDSIVPLKVALLYYQQLQAAFSGKTTALKAMQNVDKGLKSLNP